MKKILIISESDEEQVDIVIRELDQIKPDSYFRLDGDRIHVNYEISISPADFLLLNKHTGKQISASEVLSVWWTDPTVMDMRYDKEGDEDIHSYLKSEYESCIYAILNCCEYRGAKMVSSRTSLVKNSDKLYQQIIAKELGFQIPAQIVTNSSRQFLNQTWAKEAVIKPVNSHKSGGGEMFTNLVDDDLYQGIEDGTIGLDIHCFQERLRQKVEYRVVCFGTQAYTFQIKGEYEVDWRRDKDLITIDRVGDRGFESKCVEFLERMGLNFGAFDLMETKSDVYFIECNSPGYFLFCDAQNYEQLANRFAIYLLEGCR